MTAEMIGRYLIASDVRMILSTAGYRFLEIMASKELDHGSNCVSAPVCVGKLVSPLMVENAGLHGVHVLEP